MVRHRMACMALCSNQVAPAASAVPLLLQCMDTDKMREDAVYVEFSRWVHSITWGAELKWSCAWSGVSNEVLGWVYPMLESVMRC